MENLNELLVELEEFNRVTTITTTTSDDEQPIPQNLENLIEYVARTGKYIFPWPKIRKLFVLKLKNVLVKLVTLMPASANITANTNNNNNNAMLNSSFYNAANEASTSLNENSNNTSMNMSPAETLKEIKDRIVERMESFTSAPFTIQRISELLLKPSIHYKQLDKFLRGLEKCVMVVTTVDPNGNKIFIESIVPETNVTSSRQLAATPRMPTPFLSRVDDTTTIAVTNNLLSSSPPPSSTTTTTTNPQLETTPVNNNNSSSNNNSLSSPSSSSSSSLDATGEQEETKPSENLIATSTELIMVTTETHDNVSKPNEVTDLSAISVAMTTGSGGTPHEAENIVTDQVNVRVVSDQETGETTTTTTTTITSVETTDEKMTTEPNEDETEQMDHSGSNLPVESSDLETTAAVTKTTSEENKTNIVNGKCGGKEEEEEEESIAVETTTTTVSITPETANTS